MPANSSPDPRDDAGQLIVIRSEDPIAEARDLGRSLGAPVVVGGPATARAVAVWPTMRCSEPDRPGEDPVSAETDRPEARTRRAEAVLERTRSGMGEAIARSLATTLAIHPETIRRSAAEHTAALDARLAGESRPSRIGIIAGAVGVAAAVLVAGIVLGSPAAGGVAAAVVLVAAALLGVIGGRVARPSIEELDSAVEATRRRWEALAGVGADPADVEAIVRLRDPSAIRAEDVVDHSPAVRAARRVMVERRREWIREWRRDITDGDDGSENARTGGHGIPAGLGDLVADASGVVVFVDLYGGSSRGEADTIHGELLAVPDGIRAVAILGPDAADLTVETDPADGVVIDLVAAEAIAPGAPGTRLQANSPLR